MAKKIKRRDFLGLMGLGGVAAATLSCDYQPTDYEEGFDEVWKPWVEPVDGEIPYVPRFYATSLPELGSLGLHIKSINGRANKTEGNPDHPVNMGTLSARQQTVIQNLYSPDRVRKPLLDGKAITRAKTQEVLKEKLSGAKGRNVSVLAGDLSGATQDFWTQFVAAMGTGKLVRYTAFTDSYWATASEKVFGRAEVPYINLAGTDFVLSLGARFLDSWGDHTAHARNWANMKKIEDFNRGKHVQIETRTSSTGAMADTRLHCKPGSESVILLALLKEVAAKSTKLSAEDQAAIAGLVSGADMGAAAGASGLTAADLQKVAEELLAAGSAVVLPAENTVLGDQSLQHHAAVLLLNKALGGIGKHFNYAASKPATRTVHHGDISDLVQDLNGGNVDVLIVLGNPNPAFNTPGSLKFAEAMKKATFSVAFAASNDETTTLANLVVPNHHGLEAWGEVNTYEGLNQLQQPTMRPRWDMAQAEDHIIGLMKELAPDTYAQESFREYVQASFTARFGAEAADAGKFWRDCLRKGGIFAMAEAGEDLPVAANMDAGFFGAVAAMNVAGPALIVMESPRFGDGSAATSGWMQELPEAMTGVTWDSFLEISHQTAKDNNLKYGQEVEFTVNGATVAMPVITSQTMPDGVVYMETGQGRTVASETFVRGANAFSLFGGGVNAAGVFAFAPTKVSLKATGNQTKVATYHIPGLGDQLYTPMSDSPYFHEEDGKQDHRFVRDLFQTVSLKTLSEGGPKYVPHYAPYDKKLPFVKHQDKDFYDDRGNDPIYWGREEKFYEPYKWEMVVDLDTCNGCGSCVTACYAENNLPVVGKDQVAKGREMAWMRIDRFLNVKKDKQGHQKVEVNFMPMMCQQCGNAPCESVCPSLATYHNKEGLNAMVYNRCVGTRYCANNCSYKVRRFNWFSFEWDEDARWYTNPTVSVRHKGVMEKCTFCSQRIRDARNKAKDEGRLVQDGDFQTACQQVCPSKCISFGNYMDQQSEVYKLAHDQRAYRALDSHIKTKPGVSYLRRTVFDQGHA
ncbi:4Fe-4S dicluster domain-containing protein [Acanthopleuribacter pedis]|uniref:4Fe-4S dicluster domain-containing protein n=1 Tax=Acanthopleuribacter pedis TaxID=442870 RepID=A0A8J7U5H3_9BACT|nr:4Fe-4S dicluster domain-containing protein [Acanthopleuribacter pedis]MBO1320443.1 4Fe-4S dicluster domain-containing protein [Acanthopleuribacter pedis]